MINIMQERKALKYYKIWPDLEALETSSLKYWLYKLEIFDFVV